jgi:hypothetical protein
MTSKTLLTIEEYNTLPEKEGVKYELDEGELITHRQTDPTILLVKPISTWQRVQGLFGSSTLSLGWPTSIDPVGTLKCATTPSRSTTPNYCPALPPPYP